MKNLKTSLGLRNNIDILSNEAAAIRYAKNCKKLHVVIMGDNCKFWVVCFSDAQKLVKIGYEVINK